MKLIIAGATGYVATELIRQSLRRPDITSVVALARKTTPIPNDVTPGSSEAAKFTSVVVKDYEGPYDADESVKTALAGADACIWTVAITPSKSSAFPFEEVRRVCQTSTLAGLRALHASRGAKTSPFRFVYMSGIAAERDQTKKPPFKPEYSLMRGETENQILAYTAEHKSDVEAVIVKPGLITNGRIVQDNIVAPLIGMLAGVPRIPLATLATVMLDAAVNGAKSDTLVHNELDKIGKTLEEKK
ncbi:hypothetical protein Sste5346_006859 [Sporothrix stenoceras]|uniref:NAD(P)-binding domain-containing protein n=1 Tax=Sporothrix stenoceras TaxID=5173 RepID=A0ABR3YWM4_9PEZI